MRQPINRNYPTVRVTLTVDKLTHKKLAAIARVNESNMSETVRRLVNTEYYSKEEYMQREVELTK